MEIEKGVSVEVSQGIPQGSVLGPTLWNLAYDGVLRIRAGIGTKIIGFADDIAVVVSARDKTSLEVSVEIAMRKITRWMKARGLELAPQKTEAVMLRGPRIKRETSLRVGDCYIHPKRVIKYLGLMTDDRGTYWAHISHIVQKAEGMVVSLGRILGLWTKDIIPDVKSWAKCQHRVLNFFYHAGPHGSRVLSDIH